MYRMVYWWSPGSYERNDTILDDDILFQVFRSDILVDRDEMQDTMIIIKSRYAEVKAK